MHHPHRIYVPSSFSIPRFYAASLTLVEIKDRLAPTSDQSWASPLPGTRPPYLNRRKTKLTKAVPQSHSTSPNLAGHPWPATTTSELPHISCKKTSSLHLINPRFLGPRLPWRLLCVLSVLLLASTTLVVNQLAAQRQETPLPYFLINHHKLQQPCNDKGSLYPRYTSLTACKWPSTLAAQTLRVEPGPEFD